MNSKFLQKIESLGLVSFMNKTKWALLAKEFTSGKAFQPKVQYKEIGNDKLYGFSHFDWDSIRGGSNCETIEWMKIETVEHINRGRLAEKLNVDHMTELIDILKRCKISFEVEGSIIIIFGYKGGPDQLL